MIRFALIFALAALPVFSAAAPKTSAEGKVTFSEHIAPIVFNNCASCHRPGQAGPFSLLSYGDVSKRAQLIRAVTRSRYMPPWHAAPNYGSFADERRLTDEEIELIGKWVEGGMPQGDAAKLPAPPDLPQGWQFGEPDLIVEMEQPYRVPADGADIYRNFVAAIGTKEEKWVRAIEFRPGARSVMHHSLFKADTSGKARKIDARDEEPGYSGMDAGIRGLVNLGGWAVGGNTRVFPQESPKRLPPNADFIFQSHFHPSGKVETEVSAVGVYFTDKPATRTSIGFQIPPLYGRGADIDIPPGESSFTIRERFTLPAAIELYTVTPHAHYIGKSFKGWAVLPDGEEVPLIHVPDWDFAWQDSYIYAEPLRLPAGTTMHAEIVYDNSAENPHNPHNPPKRVTWGLSSVEEMGSLIFNGLAVREEDTQAIRAEYRKLQRRHVAQAAEQAKKRRRTVRRSGTSGGE